MPERFTRRLTLSGDWMPERVDERGSRSRRRAQVECLAFVRVDVDKLARFLGTKALRNKSRASSYLSGIVSCEVRPIGPPGEKS